MLGEPSEPAPTAPDATEAPPDGHHPEPADQRAEPTDLVPPAGPVAATTVPAADESTPRLERILDRLTGIEGALHEFHRRAAHRESVIDRLHEENQGLRAGIRRAILDPVVTDLVRLHDGLAGEAGRLAREHDDRTSALLASFADDVELALERCGFTLSRPEPGETFQSGTQVAAAIVPTDDPARHNTVAEVIQPGIRERETGRFRRPARTRVYRSRQPATAPVPPAAPRPEPPGRPPGHPGAPTEDGARPPDRFAT
jgi:hypothetical protein